MDLVDPVELADLLARQRADSAGQSVGGAFPPDWEASPRQPAWALALAAFLAETLPG